MATNRAIRTAWINAAHDSSVVLQAALLSERCREPLPGGRINRKHSAVTVSRVAYQDGAV
jgi:hypothetical protein